MTCACLTWCWSVQTNSMSHSPESDIFLVLIPMSLLRRFSPHISSMWPSTLTSSLLSGLIPNPGQEPDIRRAQKHVHCSRYANANKCCAWLHTPLPVPGGFSCCKNNWAPFIVKGLMYLSPRFHENFVRLCEFRAAEK